VGGGAVTRQEKIAKARELRGQGLTAKQIADRLDANESTVRNWYLGGVCDCGALIEGSSRIRRPTQCPRCHTAKQTTWTQERIIEKIQEWVDLYGETPTSYDWEPGKAKHAGSANAVAIRQRFEDGEWPHVVTVQRRFGSWNAGIERAGFDPLPAKAGPRARSGIKPRVLPTARAAA